MYKKTKNSRAYYLLLFAFLFPIFLWGQSDRIQQLEYNLPRQQGLPYIIDAMRLADWYQEAGFYDKTINMAKRAEDQAEKSKERIYRAKAMTIAAQAYIKKGGKKNWLKADEKLRNSQRLLGGNEQREIQLENILNLIRVAELLKKPKDINKYELELADLKEGMPEEEITKVEKKVGFKIFGKKKRKIEEKLDTSEEKRLGLTKILESTNEGKEVLKIQKSELRDIKNELDEILASKEEEVTKMSEEKAKAELMLAKKQYLIDSLNFAGMLDSFELARNEFILHQQEMELNKNEAKIKIQKGQRNFLIALATLIGFLAFGLYTGVVNMKKHNQVLAEKNKIIREEQIRSEQLLLNIFPVSVADELKRHGAAQARLYKQVTVLFIDFIGFSHIASTLSPKQLVGDLDFCFKAFDKIIKKYGLEKIKTIGDAYMCAGGLPEPSPKHPVKVIQAALEIQQFLADWKLEKIRKNESVFEARVGIHTGEIVAGVVGDIKFAYDIWGNTVNIASRIESNGEGGLVNISGATYELIKDKFTCEYRGKIPVKNMGEIDMYFVKN